MRSLNLILKTQAGWLFWAVAIAATFSAIFYILYLNNSFHREYSAIMEQLSQAPNLSPRSRVYIDFGNGTKRAFEGRVFNSTAIKHILAASSEAGDLKIILTKDQKNIAAIAGVANSTHKKWHIYLNDNKPIENILVTIRPGDKVTLIYR